ncbi:hypothetical protein ABT084_02525 [Streptomyces sp. NPDC002138]|uniref:hypothetical protein n=1 Tax=Streptomyces sp. NPDC002138 TaxID=3154410 RepID=UPI00331C2DB3
MTARHALTIPIGEHAHDGPHPAFFDEHGRLDAVERWWPGEGRATSTHVPLGGHDVFLATPEGKRK